MTKPDFTYCQNCGHKVEAKPVETYKTHLDANRISFLKKLKAAGGMAHYSELGLTSSEQTNCHSLIYWKLTELVKDGTYRLTQYGWDFLNDKVSIYKTCVRVKGSRGVKNFDGPLVKIGNYAEKPTRKEYIEQAKSILPDMPVQAGLNLRGTLTNG